MLSVVIRYLELHKNNASGNVNVISYQPVLSSLVVLGYGAVFFNLLFLLSYLIFFLFKKETGVPKWILTVNLILFFLQLIYFLY